MDSDGIRSKITPHEWAACLAVSRDARALILRDAESFHEAGIALEQIGQLLCGKVKHGLGGYRTCLVDLTEATGRHERAETERLFEVVREARNMAVHDGAWARHLNSRLIELFLILEEAIMTKMQNVEDIMVRSPVVAEPWHMLAQVRRTMLANSFSCLPIFLDRKWQLVCDSSVMRYVRGAANSGDRSTRLSAKLDAAVKNKHIELAPADCCAPLDTLHQVLAKMSHLPVLVTQEIDGEPRLLGIVTPFDLL